MKWIKATERLPDNPFKNVIIRHLRTREVGLGKTMGHDSYMATDFVGWNSTRGDQEFKEIEWLDESESPTTADASVLTDGLFKILNLPGDWNEFKQIARSALGEYKYPGLTNEIKAQSQESKEGEEELVTGLLKTISKVAFIEGGIEKVKHIGSSLSIRMKNGTAYWCRFEKQSTVTLD